MSPLARKLYSQLRKRVRAGQHSVTYAGLARAAGDVHPRSPALHAALGEVTNACRHTGLPVLPAIVWRAGTNRPSTGYYKVAHPRAHTDAARLAAWEREHAKVIADPARFPVSLERPARGSG
ncbi:MAG: hypothetical protein ABI467_22880 [Kofleriaceae bacterium]